MSVKSPAHITVALPEGTRPSAEMTELLIRKFLKACKKEDLQRNVLDKSVEVRRFERPANKERLRKREAKERAIREFNKLNDPNSNDKAPKRRKDKREEVKVNER